MQKMRNRKATMKDCAINYNMVSIKLLWRACKFIKIYFMVELFNNYDYFFNFLYNEKNIFY